MATLCAPPATRDDRTIGDWIRPWPDCVALSPELLEKAPRQPKNEQWLLCRVCRDMCKKVRRLRKTDRRDKIRIHTTTTSMIRTRAAKRCPFCQLVLESYPHMDGDKVLEFNLYLGFGEDKSTWTHSGRANLRYGYSMQIRCAGHDEYKMFIATLEGGQTTTKHNE